MFHGDFLILSRAAKRARKWMLNRLAELIVPIAHGARQAGFFDRPISNFEGTGRLTDEHDVLCKPDCCCLQAALRYYHELAQGRL
jgi:hypothetical protein